MVALPTFDEYVAARWPRLVRAVVLLGADTQFAEDVVQSALSRCYLRWSRITGHGDPDAYVYRAVVNEFRSSRRRFWRREIPTDPHAPTSNGASPNDVVDGVVAQTLVRQALRRLPETQQQVLVLRYFADLTERQVSEALGVPIGTIKSRAARGLASLSMDAELTASMIGRARHE